MTWVGGDGLGWTGQEIATIVYIMYKGVCAEKGSVTFRLRS